MAPYRRLAKAAKVPLSPLAWSVDRGPWYDNNLAMLEVQDDGGLSMRWLAGDVDRPRAGRPGAARGRRGERCRLRRPAPGTSRA